MCTLRCSYFTVSANWMVWLVTVAPLLAYAATVILYVPAWIPGLPKGGW